MRKFTMAGLLLSLFFTQMQAQVIITGAYDGPLSGGVPKGIELYVGSSVPDLSIYGVGSANNGGGTDGEEFTFPAVSVAAGSFVYVATDSAGFFSYFGFYPDFTTGSMSINGDDAIELFQSGVVVDVFGDINMDGSGTGWDYLDGWAYRNDGTGPDGNTFVEGNFYYSGVDATDGETSNATATTPFPIGTYTMGAASPTINLSGAGFSVDETTNSVDINVTLNITSDCTVDLALNGASTATNGGDFSYSSPQTVTFTNGGATVQAVTVTLMDDLVIEPNETIVLDLTNITGGCLMGGTDQVTVTILDDDTPTPMDLVITEIMYNSPEAGTDTLEFIELYNNSASVIDMAGYTFTAGIQHTFDSMSINPGQYIIIGKDSAGLANDLGVAGAIQWTFGGLVNSGELIRLEDGLGNVVDEVTYGDFGAWPSEADGGGFSLILCDYNVDNDNPGVWGVSSNDLAVQINGIDVFASPYMDNFCCRDFYEPNDVFAAAAWYPAEGINGDAAICSPVDEDWFEYDMAGYTNLKVYLSCLAENYQLEVYDSLQNFLASSLNGSTTPEKIILNGLDPLGSYYIRVSPRSGVYSSVGYCLHVTVGDYMIWNEDEEVVLDSEEALEGFTLYPNPVSGSSVFMDFNSLTSEKATLLITDVLGRTVSLEQLQVSEGNNHLEARTANLSTGMYFVRLSVGNQLFTQKIEVLK